MSFKTDAKSFSFYLEKQKSFIPKKIFLGRCQYQNKKALFIDPIFSEGFPTNYLNFLTLVCVLVTAWCVIIQNTFLAKRNIQD